MFSAQESWDAAVKGLTISMNEHVVVVRDGVDVWACLRQDFDSCRDDFGTFSEQTEDIGAEAYTEMCNRIPCISREGGPSDKERAIVAALLAGEVPMMDEDEIARLWGIAA